MRTLALWLLVALALVSVVSGQPDIALKPKPPTCDWIEVDIGGNSVDPQGASYHYTLTPSDVSLGTVDISVKIKLPDGVNANDAVVKLLDGPNFVLMDYSAGDSDASGSVFIALGVTIPDKPVWNPDVKIYLPDGKDKTKQCGNTITLHIKKPDEEASTGGSPPDTEGSTAAPGGNEEGSTALPPPVLDESSTGSLPPEEDGSTGGSPPSGGSHSGGSPSGGSPSGGSHSGGSPGHKDCDLFTLLIDGEVVPPVSGPGAAHFYKVNHAKLHDGKLKVEVVVAVDEDISAGDAAAIKVSFKTNQGGAEGELDFIEKVDDNLPAGSIGLLFRGEIALNEGNTNIVIKVKGKKSCHDTITIHVCDAKEDEPNPPCALTSLSLQMVSVKGGEARNNFLELTPSFAGDVYHYTYTNGDVAGDVVFKLFTEGPEGTTVAVDVNGAGFVDLEGGSGQFAVHLEADECIHISIIVGGQKCMPVCYDISCLPPTPGGNEEGSTGLPTPVETSTGGGSPPPGTPADCRLQSLSLGPGMSYLPAFDPDRHHYKCQCITTVFITALTATALDSSHLIDITQALNDGTATDLITGEESASYMLQDGMNTVTIHTKGDQCEDEYEIKCVRYTKPTNGGLYNWAFSAWSQCSGVCQDGDLTSEGDHTRSVICVNELGGTVDDSYCTGLGFSKPNIANKCLTYCGSLARDSVTTTNPDGSQTTVQAGSNGASANSASFAIMAAAAIVAAMAAKL